MKKGLSILFEVDLTVVFSGFQCFFFFSPFNGFQSFFVVLTCFNRCFKWFLKVIQTITPYIEREDFDPAAIKKAGSPCLNLRE